MVNISWFWHDHSCISTKKPIQLGMKLLKEKKNQIDNFLQKVFNK